MALHAEVLLTRDRDYIVRDGRIELVDEFTGRVADNRRWPHGIQPAVEAKEGVEVRPEGAVLGSIPIQHFVRLWPRIAGMTATAVPAAEEFKEFYGLTTVVFPPNRPCRRVDEPDVVFTHREREDGGPRRRDCARAGRRGGPVLVGTASVAESEELFRALRARGSSAACSTPGTTRARRSSSRRAGMPGAVTISTNMAGRGTDIVLGGGDAALHERVAALGGLYVIGTNRHESRRIDDQLRGPRRAPGRPRLEPVLHQPRRRPHPPLRRGGAHPGAAPARRRRTGRSTTRSSRREIARAQRIIEGQNFDIRRTLWRYSAMVEEQRAQICERREELLHDVSEPTACAEGAPGPLRRRWSAPSAPSELARVENRLTHAPARPALERPPARSSRTSARASTCSGTAAATRSPSSSGRSSTPTPR